MVYDLFLWFECHPRYLGVTYEDDVFLFVRQVEDIHQETLGRCLSLRYYENVLFAFSQTSHDHNVPLYQWFVKRIRFQYRYV